MEENKEQYGDKYEECHTTLHKCILLTKASVYIYIIIIYYYKQLDTVKADDEELLSRGENTNEIPVDNNGKQRINCY